MNSEVLDGLRGRIRECAQLVGSGDELARRSGVPRSTLERYLSGRSEPKAGNLAAIAGAAGVSLDWLMFGKQVPAAGGGEGDQVDLPVMAARLSGGGGSFLDGQNVIGYFGFSRRWLREKLGPLDHANLCIVGVVGDSMEPTIHQGDDLMIDLSQKSLLDNAIYAIRWDGALVVKRLQRMLDGITIISDNSLYRPETVSRAQAEQMEILGRVRWIGKVL